MKRDTFTTDVCFYYEPDSTSNEVFAVFPNNVEHTGIIGGKKTIYYLCYAHSGQHSTVSATYLKGLKKATEKYFKPLAHELEQLGYNLNIL